MLFHWCAEAEALMTGSVSCSSFGFMGEFLGRWVSTGVFGSVTLALAGLRASGALSWVLLGLWLGFWNAGLRLLVLRFPVSTGNVIWWLLLALAALNLGVLWSVRAMVPSVWSGDIQHPLWVVASLTLWSWALSCWFRARDGRWHLISYHGSIRGK